MLHASWCRLISVALTTFLATTACGNKGKENEDRRSDSEQRQAKETVQAERGKMDEAAKPESAIKALPPSLVSQADFEPDREGMVSSNPRLQPTPQPVPAPVPVPALALETPSDDQAHPQVEARQIPEGTLYVPKVLGAHESIGQNDDCNGALGKLELNFNTGSNLQFFAPAVNLCIEQELFGTRRLAPLWQTLDRKFFSWDVLSHYVGGMTLKDASGEYKAILVTLEQLNNGRWYSRCETEESAGQIDGLSPSVPCPDEAFAQVTVAQDLASLAATIGGETHTIPLFKTAPLSSYPGQTFESLRSALLSAAGNADNLAVGIGAEGYSKPESEQQLYLDLLLEWKASTSGRESAFYSAVGNMGTSLALPLAQPLFAALNLSDVAAGVTMLRRVKATDDITALMLGAIERAYPASIGIGASEARSILVDGLEYLNAPTSATVRRLRALYDAREEKSYDLKRWLGNHES